jgi:hypothetical protein
VHVSLTWEDGNTNERRWQCERGRDGEDDGAEVASIECMGERRVVDEARQWLVGPILPPLPTTSRQFHYPSTRIRADRRPSPPCRVDGC